MLDEVQLAGVPIRDEDVFKLAGLLRTDGFEDAADSPIDFTDFAAADFAAEGVIVELGEDVELHIALSM